MGISTSIKRVRAHVNPFVFHGEVPSFSLPSGPLDIEIGFAKGDFLCHWAQLKNGHWSKTLVMWQFFAAVSDISSRTSEIK